MLSARKILMVGASVFAFGIGTAMAANTSIVNQPAANDSATVDQDAGNNYSNIQQTATYSSANVKQDGGTNSSIINQIASGTGFKATVNQSGAGTSSAKITQTDHSNKTASITQDSVAGPANNATIDQRQGTNAYQKAKIVQEGWGNTATETQRGSYDDALIKQTTNNNTSTITQTGDNDTASNYQMAANGSSSTITQSGNANTATVNQ